MFSVSEAYKTQVQKPVKVRTLHGTLAHIAFTPRDVIMDSFSITNQCSDSGRFTIGETFSAELNITFTNAFISSHWAETEINYWKRKVIEIKIDLEVPQQSGEVPCSVFRVADISKDNGGYHIVAYDLMGRFERKLKLTRTAGKPYDFLTEACNKSNMILGMTPSEVALLPNGNDVISLWDKHELKTYRDLIGAIAGYCGSFATINRYGDLELRSYNAGRNSSVWTYTNDDVHNDISESQFQRCYDAVVGESKNLEATISYPFTYEEEKAVDIGANPFMQDYDEQLFRVKLSNIAHGLPQDYHTPCSFSTSQDYFLDLGDKVTLPSGKTAYVMGYEFTMQGITVTCYGEDTDSSTTSSSGSSSGNSSNWVVFYYGESQSPFIVGNERQIVNTVEFLASQETEANTWTEIKGHVTQYDLDEPVKVRVIYLYDGEEVGYSPEYTFNQSGNQTLSLNYYIDSIEKSIGHSWDVVLKVTGGAFEIAKNEVHTMIWGQGLTKADRWDGKIKINEEILIRLFKYSPQSLKSITDGMNADLVTPVISNISEVFQDVIYNNNSFQNFADFVILTVGEPNPNNIFFTGEAYAGENIPLI